MRQRERMRVKEKRTSGVKKGVAASDERCVNIGRWWYCVIMIFAGLRLMSI